MSLATAHKRPGKLIVFEGIDGAGKSTQVGELLRRLRSDGVNAEAVQANSSGSAVPRRTEQTALSPETAALVHAADFAYRLDTQILPALNGGTTVCADRYVFTAFAREVVRGADRKWIRDVYAFAIRPDLCFWLRVPVEEALERILRSRARPAYSEAGMDLKLSADVAKGFKVFQKRIADEYERMVPEFGFHVIDGSQSIEAQHAEIRRVADARFGAGPDQTRRRQRKHA